MNKVQVPKNVQSLFKHVFLKDINSFSKKDLDLKPFTKKGFGFDLELKIFKEFGFKSISKDFTPTLIFSIMAKL